MKWRIAIFGIYVCLLLLMIVAFVFNVTSPKVNAPWLSWMLAMIDVVAGGFYIELIRNSWRQITESASYKALVLTMRYTELLTDIGEYVPSVQNAPSVQSAKRFRSFFARLWVFHKQPKAELEDNPLALTELAIFHAILFGMEMQRFLNSPEGLKHKDILEDATPQMSISYKKVGENLLQLDTVLASLRAREHPPLLALTIMES